MLKLKNGFSPRIPDHLAVLAAVTLTVTAGASVLSEQFGNESIASGPNAEREKASLNTRADSHDPTSDDSASQGSLASRLLLFRRG